jgi:hypothetical protein
LEELRWLEHSELVSEVPALQDVVPLEQQVAEQLRKYHLQLPGLR